MNERLFGGYTWLIPVIQIADVCINFNERLFGGDTWEITLLEMSAGTSDTCDMW